MNITGIFCALLFVLSCFFSFDFCVGSENESPVENLGQVLFGERIRPSPYQVL